MSTDAWIEEHWIGEAVLPRPRRAPKLPALQVPHAPTCARGNTPLAAHAQSRDSARHPGDGLSARQNGRNVVDQQARKLTQPRRPAFLAVMERAVPWPALCGLIAPVYPKPGNGRPPVGVERLRIYFLQQWFNLSDP